MAIAGRPCIDVAGAALTTISYLVHDTMDAAVARRLRMFQTGGAQVRLAGFNRRGAPSDVAGVPVRDFGRTANAKLTGRAVAVARHLVWPTVARSVVRDSDVVVARNLETLAIAVRVAAPGQRIVFECLDIHRLLLSPGAAGRALRAVERRLLRRVDLIITSSPAFDQRYFKARQRFVGQVLVVENRLLELSDTPVPKAAQRDSEGGGTPVRIGWFGMLRCRKSLALLRDLALANPGRIEVVIAGIPSYCEFDDFDRDVANVPGVSFVGSYRAADLPRLYGSVDFAWAIDYFEEGLNSAWLLPNRLYESLALGAVPIALAHVETGRWLEARQVGLRLRDPATDLAPILQDMSAAEMTDLRRLVAALPLHLVVADECDCRALVAAVAGEAQRG